MPDEATIKFACRHCGQSIEAPIEIAGTAIDCPTCGKGLIVPGGVTVITKRRSRAPFFAVCFVLLTICGIVFIIKSHHQFNEHIAEIERERNERPEKYEDAFQSKIRYEKEAEAEMLKECSNYVGFTRVLTHYVIASDKPVSNWTASADIDFVNKVGGIERTNLLFRCFLLKTDSEDHHCFAAIDEGAMWDRYMKQEDEARRIRSGQ
jgi:DNA-directed RNA polymerase subunit RPC12/RpoP